MHQTPLILTHTTHIITENGYETLIQVLLLLNNKLFKVTFTFIVNTILK